MAKIKNNPDGCICQRKLAENNGDCAKCYKED